MDKQLQALVALYKQADLPPGPFTWEQVYEMGEDSVHWAICDPQSAKDGRCTHHLLVLLASWPTYSLDAPETWGTPLDQHPLLQLLVGMLNWCAEQAAVMRREEEVGG